MHKPFACTGCGQVRHFTEDVLSVTVFCRCSATPVIFRRLIGGVPVVAAG